MYEIIKNPKMMTEEEIVKKYTGKWVYVVKANIDRHGALIEGMPVVLGEFQYAGVEEGIYKQFDGPEYESRLSYTLIPLDNTVTSAFGVGWN